MNIQNLFYLLGSIYLVLGIIISIGLIVLMIYAAKVLAAMKKNVDEKLDTLKDAVQDVQEMAHEVTSHPAHIAQGGGKLLADMFMFGMRRMIQRV